jgi:hypothetical protein
MEDGRCRQFIFDPPSSNFHRSCSSEVHLSGELNFKRVPLFERSQEVMTFADDQPLKETNTHVAAHD